MQRVTISLEKDLSDAFDVLLKEQGYQNRSEAIRDLVRQALERQRAQADEGAYCVANLSYVYDHHTRALAQRLIDIQHEQHDLVVATTHVHLDHDNCLETIILKGKTSQVRTLAEHIKAERGVRFGMINLISVAPNDDHHHHAHDHSGHIHLSPHKG
jgi:CopG family transcriptional regulator, nickel-responsive regulator